MKSLMDSNNQKIQEFFEEKENNPNKNFEDLKN